VALLEDLLSRPRQGIQGIASKVRSDAVSGALDGLRTPQAPTQPVPVTPGPDLSSLASKPLPFTPPQTQSGDPFALAMGVIFNGGIGGTGSPQGDIDHAIGVRMDQLGGGDSGSDYSGGTSFDPLKGGRYPIQDPTPAPLPNPGVATPEIQRAYDEIWSRWPGVSNLGTHVVKNISGTSTPSQHSYGNAIDIGGTDGQLTEIASWAARRAAALGLSQVIFKDRIWTTEQGWHSYTAGGHETHVHLTGPQVYGDTTPSYPVIDWKPKPKTRPKTKPRQVSKGSVQQR